MKKPVKIGLYLLAMAMLLASLWRVLDLPRFTAEQAFRRVEQREMVPKSRILGSWELPPYSRIGGGAYGGVWKRVLVAGVTDTHLHMTQVEHKWPRWNSRESLMSLPLEGDVLELLPWDLYSMDHWQAGNGVPGAVVYTRQDCARLEWKLTVGDRVFTGWQAPEAENDGFVPVPFSALEGSDNRTWQEQVELRTYHWRNTHFDRSRMTMDVALEVTLLDENGEVLRRLVREYPKTEDGSAAGGS